MLRALIALVALAAPAAAEPCHEGDVVAARNIDLVPLRGVTCLRGSLTITKDVTSLAALRSLIEIDGTLRIVSASRLSSLRGLDALERAGGVHVGGPKQGVPKLRDIDGLRRLAEIRGDLWIGGGWIFRPGNSLIASMRRISGLTSLAFVKGGVTLFDVDSFSGLPALVEVGGDVAIEHGKLRRLGGFKKLARIGGSLRIRGNARLRHIDAFRALEEIAGHVEVGCGATNDVLADATLRKHLEHVTVKGRVRFAGQQGPDMPGSCDD